MKITTELIETLLWEAEGTSLDFKSEQYPFAGATDQEKSELLKDILAFANATKRADAFILIGVKEVKAGRAEVTGVANQLEDAHLQQFVNSKVQRPIEFSYRAIEFEGKPIGILHIPRQKRPFYVKASYGAVAKNVVYIRRGSSTGTASLDEVASMGADQLAASSGEPLLTFNILDKALGRIIGTAVELQCIALNVPSDEEIPDHEDDHSHYTIGMFSTNRDYYRELVRYTVLRHLLQKVSFAVTNSGDATALDVRVIFEIPDPDDVLSLMEEDDFPEVPKAQFNRLVPDIPKLRSIQDEQALYVRRIDSRWRIECLFGKIQPKATEWLPDSLLIGAWQSTELTLETRMFADNLPQPVSTELKLRLQVEERDASLEDCANLEFERFRATPEGRELFSNESSNEDKQ